jgi:hypothetical protein
LFVVFSNTFMRFIESQKAIACRNRVSCFIKKDLSSFFQGLYFSPLDSVIDLIYIQKPSAYSVIIILDPSVT